MKHYSGNLFLRSLCLLLVIVVLFSSRAVGVSPAFQASTYSAFQASTYYVSPQGADSNPGSQASPWRTLIYAVTQVEPGDVVLVADGIYEGPVIITRSGTPNAYITLKSINKWGAKVETLNGEGNADGIKAAANYLTIDGFELYDPDPAPSHHGNGITVYDNHHVNILNNKIHDYGGSGIQAAHFDHVLIENNVVYNNAKYNPNQSSGISMWQARAVDDAPGYHAIIRNNRSYGNINLVPTPAGITRDGNGILIDDFWNSTGDELNIVFPHRTLIENNLCYDNGGKGIQVFKSSFVDVFNNTAYHNNHDEQNPGTWRAELSLAYGDQTVWRNNIGVSNPGQGILEWNRGILIARGGTTVWENNLTFSGTPGDPTIHVDNGSVDEEYVDDNNFLGLDPEFGNAALLDFSLTLQSPALNAGSDEIVSFIDINYIPRPQGAVDLGAFEFNDDPLPVELTSFDAVVSESKIHLAWTTASELNNAGFEVQLRTAGRDFETVQFIEGRGTTDLQQVYQATLSDLVPGAYGVRLKQVDFDGTFAFSDVVTAAVAVEVFVLEQNYPNPFNPETVIRYALPVAGEVSLDVYDALGRHIETLVDGHQTAGAYAVRFNANELPNGAYVYRLVTQGYAETRTMLLVR